MSSTLISEANDPDLRNIEVALNRAAVHSRLIAKESVVRLEVNRGGRLILIDPEDSPDSSIRACKFM